MITKDGNFKRCVCVCTQVVWWGKGEGGREGGRERERERETSLL